MVDRANYVQDHGVACDLKGGGGWALCCLKSLGCNVGGVSLDVSFELLMKCLFMFRLTLTLSQLAQHGVRKSTVTMVAITVVTMTSLKTVTVIYRLHHDSLIRTRHVTS